MTIRVEETIESRSTTATFDQNSRKLELEFWCWDDTRPEVDVDPQDVIDEVLSVVSAAPYGLTYNGLRFQSISLKAVTKSIYMATVPYGVLDPNKIKFGLSTHGGEEKITHSLATIAAYPATGYEADVDDHQHAIHVTKNGIQGSKRLVPELALRVIAQFDPTDWTAAHWFLLTELSGTWNVFAWHGWPAKVLLFEFAECAEYGIAEGEKVPVTFHFKVKTEEHVDKGLGIEFDKDGWDLVWDDTRQVIRTDDYALTPRAGSSIRATYREQIYYGSDFELLGLGK